VAALGGDLEEAERALRADDERPRTHLVAWPGRSTPDELVAACGGELGPYSPFAVRMTGGDPGDLSAVRDLRAGVQDEGSQLCALALADAPLADAPLADAPLADAPLNGAPLAGAPLSSAPLDGGPPDRGGARWLDMCAGPGGKAALLAALASQRGATLTANERREHRADLVRRVTRAWDVEVLVGDARRLTPVDGGYDRVLVDVPCTGLGALRRRPEARWRRRSEDLDELTVLQRELLAAALGLTRPGGVVAYVTCSPHPAETVDVVAGHHLLDARACLPTVPDLGDGPWVQLWPHRHGTDAMFLALIRRDG
jgi:16S rRNA (cytosine967-C5)-methyltransferase